MSNPNEKDDVLFEQLNRAKQKKKRRTIFTAVSIAAVILIGAGIAVSVMRKNVRERFASQSADVKSYDAQVGRISTTVSGTGVLDTVDAEQITVPAGVEVEEILVSAGDTLKAGEVLASVKVSSVMSALSDAQDTLDDLDDQINSAKNDTVSAYMRAGVAGRVKKIYAESGVNVVDCMTEYGALAVLSMDGLMTVTVDASLEPQSAVTVVDPNGKEYPGAVESSAGGKSTVTLTDNGPVFGDTVTVRSGEETVGTGLLGIHNPLSITGYAGTVGRISVRENQQVYSGTTLFSLTNTAYSANYDSLIQTRAETEKTMNTLIALLRNGTLEAPFDGTVSSVDYSEEGSTSALSAYTQSSSSADTAIATMAPDVQMCVDVGIDETDILSLALGQRAEVTVSSIADDPFPGEVTEITKVGTSYSGVTQYSAVVTLDKAAGMLSGMSATVDIQIQGVDDVVLIPVDALHQMRDRAYVYTSYNEETKEYGGMVEVVAGASNSNFVEIVSGLNAGDTVYYTERSNFNFFNMMGGSRSRMMGSRSSRANQSMPGGMPQGGMPQGVRPGMGG